jgi:hypothetical protein
VHTDLYTPDHLARDRAKIQEMQHARQHHCACKIAARALDALEQTWEEVERLKTELRHRDDYDNRVPDPRRHKYFDHECSEGCKSLALRNEIERLREFAWDILLGNCITSINGELHVDNKCQSTYEDATNYFEGIGWLEGVNQRLSKVVRKTEDSK